MKEIRNVYEVRAVDSDVHSMSITGTAVVYDTRINTGWGFDESVASGAAHEALERGKQFLLWQHDISEPLASVESRTLRLREDSGGVRFEADLVDTTRGRDAYALIKSGVIRKMSFGFTIKEERWERVENRDVRTIVSIDELFEISVVTMPAYEDTDVEARNKAIEIARRNKPAGASNGMVKISDCERYSLERNKKNISYRRNIV